MKNIEITQTGNIMTIKIDLSKRFGRSKSGKSEVIATTEGNVSSPSDEKIKIGINVYTA